MTAHDHRNACSPSRNRCSRSPGTAAHDGPEYAVINALKIAACNAERLLVRQFDEAYEQPKDAFSVFRALLHLPGHVWATGPRDLEVRLQRPDSEKVARALAALLAQISQDPPRMLGDGPHLRFSLQPLA